MDYSQNPIFIHSLFRSGSTYMFNAFRRMRTKEGALYTTFQEPIHEIVSFAAGTYWSFSSLTPAGAPSSAFCATELDAPYFKELYESHEAWRHVFAEEIVYADYFGYSSEKTAAYLAAIIASAPHRPVIQECRTSLRIAQLKSALGGVHIHLWRNPWDQWWSFKSTDYFDTALQVILNAALCPPAISILKRTMGFPAIGGATLQEQFNFYARHRPAAEDSYLTFFMIWTMALEHGRRGADVDINIDLLSTSDEYRRSVTAKLSEAGVDAPDFSDAHAPQAFYGEADAAFFEPLEKRVSEMLTRSGYDLGTLAALDHIRARATPIARHEGLQSELVRLREVLRRVETRESHLLARYASELDVARHRAAEAEAEAEAARHKAAEVAEVARAHAQEITDLRASASWRVTAPLRSIKRAVTCLLNGVLAWAKLRLRPHDRPRA